MFLRHSAGCKKGLLPFFCQDFPLITKPQYKHGRWLVPNVPWSTRPLHLRLVGIVMRRSGHVVKRSRSLVLNAYPKQCHEFQMAGRLLAPCLLYVFLGNKILVTHRPCTIAPAILQVSQPYLTYKAVDHGKENRIPFSLCKMGASTVPTILRARNIAGWACGLRLPSA